MLMLEQLEKWLRHTKERRIEITYRRDGDYDEPGWDVRLVSADDKISEEENVTFVEKDRSLADAIEQAPNEEQLKKRERAHARVSAWLNDCRKELDIINFFAANSPALEVFSTITRATASSEGIEAQRVEDRLASMRVFLKCTNEELIPFLIDFVGWFANDLKKYVAAEVLKENP